MFQCIQSSNSSNLQTLKLPKLLSNIRTPRLSNFQIFEVRKFETFNPPKIETFRTFKLSTFRTFKLSNSLDFKLSSSKLSNFRTRAWGLLCEPLRVLQRSFTLLPPRCRGFKLPSRIPIQTFKLQTRAHFRNRNSQTFNFQTLQSRPTYNTFRLSKNSSSKNPTRDTSLTV